MNHQNHKENSSNEVVRNLIEMHQKAVNNYEFDRMIQSVSPFLNYFGLNHFFYVRILSSGYYTTFGTNSRLQEFAYANPEIFSSYPCIRHPKIMKQGVFIDSYSIDHNFQNSLQLFTNKCNTNYTISIRKKVNNGFETYGFATHFTTNTVVNYLINNISLVHKFIDFFVSENKKFIQNTQKNQVNIVPLLGSYFYEKESGFLDLSKRSINKKFKLKNFNIS